MCAKKVFLLLNGEKPKSLPDFKEYALICATDGAYQFLKNNDIVPHFISGDFDSLARIPDEIEVVKTPNQEFTDFDKILHLLAQKGYHKIDVFGASGQEQDHFLGNLHTALQWRNQLELTFFDNYGHYFLAKKQTKLEGCLNDTISLIPFPKAKNISTKGLQYPLKNEDLTIKKRIGTRNKAISNQVSITFKSGALFIFIYQNNV